LGLSHGFSVHGSGNIPRTSHGNYTEKIPENARECQIRKCCNYRHLRECQGMPKTVLKHF
jgi:hypothetical protein